MNESDDFVEDPIQDDFVEDDFVEEAATKSEKEERTPFAKAARLGAQYGIGRLEGTPSGIVYDLAVAPLSSKEAQLVPYRESVFEDIERLEEQKLAGVWDKKDQELYDHLIEQAKDVEKSQEFVQTSPDLSIRGLASQITGVNLHPEGVYEKAASWAGFIKDPRKMKDLFAIGLTPKGLTKALVPYPNEIFRGLGAGTALQLAEDGQFGPLGTIAAAVFGDILGHAPKAIGKTLLNPKQAIAETVNFLTMNNTKRLVATQLAQDFADSGLKIDAGTLTQSPLVQMMQARLSQSGLTGNALDNFRKELSGQVIKEYQSILGDLGEITFENSHQASEAIKNALKVEEVALNTPKESLKQQGKESPSLQGRVAIEERPNYQQNLLERISPEETRNTYQGGEDLKTAAEDIRTPIKEDFDRRWTDFNREITQIESAPQAQLVSELESFVNNHRGLFCLANQHQKLVC